MRRHLVTFTVALGAATASLGLVAGGALADSTAPAAPAVAATSTATPGKAPKPTKPTKPTQPTPTVPAVKATARLYLYDAFFVRRQTVDVLGRPLHVTGYVRPYVPNQKLTLKAYLGKKLISIHRLRIRPTASGQAGKFVGTVTAHGHGILHLEAVHARTARLRGFTARRGVNVLAPDTQSGLYASLVQQRLAKRHIYVPQTGVWDAQTEWAIDAYHRLLGRGTSRALDGPTLTSLLDGRGSFKVRYPGDGTHAEGDLGNQLLALIQGSRVHAIYPISSGKPSTPTILGRFHVYLRTPGYLPDGMYYSSFFIRGYAIHGYDPAPDYAASHGCMRLPISDAISVYDWLDYGDAVDVYQ